MVGTDRSVAVGPHPLIPTFAEELVGLLHQRFRFCPHLRRLHCQDIGHRASLPNLFVQSFPIGEGRGVVLWRHPDIHDTTLQAGIAGD
jgi:hypothetical protein